MRISGLSITQFLKRMLPHALILLVATLYTIAGGYAFYAMERHFRNEAPSSSNDNSISSKYDPFVSKCNRPRMSLLLDAAREQCVVKPRISYATYNRVNFSLAKNECATVLSQLATCIRPKAPKSLVIRKKRAAESDDPETSDDAGGTDGGDSLLKWTPTGCIFMALTIISTIGYGHVAPVTPVGRIFCIVYGLFGIPLALLAIADQGRFITESVLFVYKKVKWLGRLILKRCRIWYYAIRRLPMPPDPEKKKRLGGGVDGEEGEEDQETMPPVLLSIVFGFYMILGACIIAPYENWTFVDGVYFTFISSSTIGFGDLLPKNERMFPITLMYIALGLALATAAVDVFAQYLRRLHTWGAKIRNCANKLVWFGGERVTMSQLVRVVGTQLGVSEDKIQNLMENFDEVVVQTIQENQELHAPAPPSPPPEPTPTPEPEPEPKTPEPPVHDALGALIPFIDTGENKREGSESSDSFL